MKAPQRDEVWLVDLGMTAKVRPALVISIPADDADRALVTLVPHTTSVRGSRFEAVVQVGFLKVGAFDAQSLVTVPHARLLYVLANSVRRSSLRLRRLPDLAWAWKLRGLTSRCTRRLRYQER